MAVLSGDSMIKGGGFWTGGSTVIFSVGNSLEITKTTTEERRRFPEKREP